MTDTLFGPNSAFSIAFKIGNFPIYWYAIISIIGYFTAICIFLIVLSKRYKLSADVGFYYIFFALPMIILGARFWSCAIGDAEWKEFFNFRNGGLAVQGGVLFGVITALIYFPLMLKRPKYHVRVHDNGNVYIKRPSMWIYADAIVPTILIGQAIGRWGNFFNGEIYGAPVSSQSLAWLQTIMPGVYNHMTPAAGIDLSVGGEIYRSGQYFQPLFLYESFLNIITFTVIYGVLAEFEEMKAGTICCLYFIDYGIIRFIMESLRSPAFRFTATFILNGFLLGIGVILFIYCQWINPLFRSKKNFIFVKDYLIYLFNKSNMQKPLFNDKKYHREESGLVYFANH